MQCVTRGTLRTMPAKNPRVNMVLEAELYDMVRDLARRDRVSISQKARDLVRDALELLEDMVLDQIASERARKARPKDFITHKEVKKRLGLR